MKKHSKKICTLLLVVLFLFNPFTVNADEVKNEDSMENFCKTIKVTEYYDSSFSISEKLRYREGKLRGFLDIKSKKINHNKAKWEVDFEGEICETDGIESNISGVYILVLPY
ncbi:hypothetical protein [Microaceticoccus formicicus]|uniref:hypothetical protein n=1 Tax=Microaceticoccus formicicus TaxID=3118105 RepID=UPI003CD010C4|nr:hypothetical protein VZL98_08290 [Peptoniphilaceae bacterium AMB_02]